jgi:hypothetical protein
MQEIRKGSFLTEYDFNCRIQRFLVFLGFFIVFFLYHRDVIYDRPWLLYTATTLMFILFIISVYRIKIGLYIFIFFIPLLTFITTVFGIRNINFILFLFLSLFLGFLVNRGVNIEESICCRRFKLHYENEIAPAIFIFIIIVLASSIITIYRYANFIPLLSSGYNNLAVNIDGTGSTGSILWTIKFFFNYLIGYGLLFIVFNTFKKVEEIIRAVIIIIASNIIFFAVGFYQHFMSPTFGSFTQWAESNRINATFTDPNALGNYIILAFPLYIILIIYYRRWYQRLAGSILLGVLLLITLFSGSRNAMAGIMAALGAFAIIGIIRLVKFLILKSKQSRKIRNISIILAALVMAVVVIFISLFTVVMVSRVELKDKYRPPETGIALFDRTVDTIWMSYNVYRQAGFIEAFKSVSSERHFIWEQALNMFMDYKITGVGLGGFIIELPNYYEVNESAVRIIDYTGNYYLQILSELGIIGLVMLLFIFFLIIKKVYRYYREGRSLKKEDRSDWFLTGFFISFISMVMLLFFGPHTNFNEIQFTFWLIIGLAITFIRIRESGFYSGGHDLEYRIPERGKAALDVIKRVSLDKDRKIGLALVILIFAGSLFYSSWSELSINIRQKEVGWENYYGYYHEEVIGGRTIRWISKDAGTIIEKEGEKLIVPVKDADPAGHLLPLFIRFFVDNRMVKVVKISDKQWQDVEIDLSGYGEEQFTFTISCSRSWVPKERGLSNDTRELGVMTGEFEFVR